MQVDNHSSVILLIVRVCHAIYFSCVPVYHAIYLEHLTHKDLCEKMAALLSVHACQLKETYVQGPSGALSHTPGTTSVTVYLLVLMTCFSIHAHTFWWSKHVRVVLPMVDPVIDKYIDSAGIQVLVTDDVVQNFANESRYLIDAFQGSFRQRTSDHVLYITCFSSRASVHVLQITCFTARSCNGRSVSWEL